MSYSQKSALGFFPLILQNLAVLVMREVSFSLFLHLAGKSDTCGFCNTLICPEAVG